MKKFKFHKSSIDPFVGPIWMLQKQNNVEVRMRKSHTDVKNKLSQIIAAQVDDLSNGLIMPLDAKRNIEWHIKELFKLT